MRYFALVVLLFTTGLLDAQAQLTIRRIDIGGAYTRSFAYAVNGRGLVVGHGAIGSFEGTMFTWTAARGLREVLPTGVPTDVNNRGQVVGSLRCSACGEQDRGFVWTASGGVRNLGDFYPTAINEAGDMAGGLHVQPCAMIGGRRFTIASAGQTYAINESGVVAGTRFTTSGALRPFIWSRQGGRRALDYAPWSHGRARSINDFGQVVGVLDGNTSLPPAQAHVGVRWRTIGRITAIHSDPTFPLSVENHGWVVGFDTSAADNASYPILWRNGRVTRLPIGADGRAGHAWDINESGVIVGDVSRTDGQNRATVWMLSDH